MRPAFLLTKIEIGSVLRSVDFSLAAASSLACSAVQAAFAAAKASGVFVGFDRACLIDGPLCFGDLGLGLEQRVPGALDGFRVGRLVHGLGGGVALRARGREGKLGAPMRATIAALASAALRGGGRNGSFGGLAGGGCIRNRLPSGGLGALERIDER